MADIREFIQEEIKTLAFKKVGFDDSLVKSKLLDSITFVELLVSIEDKSGKTFPLHMVNADTLDTINMISNALETL